MSALSDDLPVMAIPYHRAVSTNSVICFTGDQDIPIEASFREQWLLDHLRKPKTITEHARDIIALQGASRAKDSSMTSGVASLLRACLAFSRGAALAVAQGEIEGEIALLRKKRLVATERDIVASITGQDYEPETAQQETSAYLGVVTSDRPQELHRLLREHCSLAPKSSELRGIIVDDSKLNRNVELTAKFIQAARQKSGQSILHVTAGARRRLLDALGAHSEVAKNVIEFGMGQQRDCRSVGAARNVAHLLCCGSKAEFIDDDTLPRYAKRLDETGYSTRTCSSGLDFSTTFYQDTSWQSEVNADRRDVTELIRRLIGRSVAAVMKEADQQRIVDLEPSSLLDLRSRSHRVGICSLGALGDTGMRSNLGFVLGSFGQAENGAQPAPHASLRSCRRVKHMSKTVLLTTNPSFQSMAYYIDLSIMYPPFFPLGRNTDGVFAALARKTSPEALIAHVPYAIWHDPPGERHSPSLIETVSNPRLADWLVLIIGRLSTTQKHSTEDRLVSIGRQLIELTAVSTKQWKAYLLDIAVEQRVRQLLAVDQQLSKLEDSCEWAEDLKELKNYLLRVHTTITCVSGGEEPASMDWQSSRDQIKRYGELLLAWPTVWKAMIKLQGNGLESLLHRA